jgi:hypothetical protein
MKGLSIRLLVATAISTLLLVPGTFALVPGEMAVAANAPKVAACNGNNFWAGLIGSSGASGNTFYTVALINEGHTTCRLAGYPTFHGMKDNRVFSIPAQHLNSQPFGISPTILAPRTSGELILTTGDVCDALITGGQMKIKKVMSENTYTNFSVTFPKSGVRVYVPGIDLDVACGLNTTELGWDGAIG